MFESEQFVKEASSICNAVNAWLLSNGAGRINLSMFYDKAENQNVV